MVMFFMLAHQRAHGLAGYDVALTRRRSSHFSSIKVDDNNVKIYIQIRKLSGIGQRHLDEVIGILTNYLDFCDFSLTKKKTLDFLQHIKGQCSISRYRKQFYQIRKFLTYLKVDWLDNVEVPHEPQCSIKRIGLAKLRDALDYFSGHDRFIQIRALLLLGATSGLRAEELYQLRPKDIDLEQRIVYVNHKPENGQTTKTKKSRISFFNKETQDALQEYIPHYTDNGFQ